MFAHIINFVESHCLQNIFKKSQLSTRDMAIQIRKDVYYFKQWRHPKFYSNKFNAK